MVPSDYVHRIGRTGRAGGGRRRLPGVRRRDAAPARDRAPAGRTDPIRGHPGLRPDPNARPEPIRLRSGQPHGGVRRTARTRTRHVPPALAGFAARAGARASATAPAVGRACLGALSPVANQATVGGRTPARATIELTVGRTILSPHAQGARCCIASGKAGPDRWVDGRSVGPSQPGCRAGGAERLTAPDSRIHVSLFRGSDSGTICYDIMVPADEPGSPQHSTSAELRTEPVDREFGVPAGDVVFEFELGLVGEVSSACATGLDPAVVTDIFASPGDYHLTLMDCFDIIGCFWRSVPLAVEAETPPIAEPLPATGPLPDTSATPPQQRQPSVAAALVGLGLLAAGMTLARRRRGAR